MRKKIYVLMAFACFLSTEAVAQGRTYLTSQLDMYVSPPGLPTAPCTMAQPCSSWAVALHRLQSSYDLGGQQVRVYVAPGQYGDTDPANIGQVKGQFVGQVGAASVQVIGLGSNANSVQLRPLIGYCVSAQDGAAFMVSNMRCDQTANTSNPHGPGQDMVLAYNGATLVLDKFVFGDNGAGNIPDASAGGGTYAPFNDITIIKATVKITGCVMPTSPNTWPCFIVLDKTAGRKYQAHILNDNGYFIHDNDNCLGTYCTAYYLNGAFPHAQFNIININGAITNWGAFVYPQASNVNAQQCSNRLNAIVFTAGKAQGPQPNMALPGIPNTCVNSKGAQTE